MRRIALLALIAAGCQSYAVQTRSTAHGGAYVLFPASEEVVPATVRDALAAIAWDCGGDYEVTALDLLPDADSRGLPKVYLDLEGRTQSGMFHTQIDYECRAPASKALNVRLASVAAQAGETTPEADAPKQCFITYDCPERSVCTPTPVPCTDAD